MNLNEIIGSENTPLTIHDHVVEFGTRTIQISNISTTDIERIVLELNEPEPTFYESEPTFEINYKAAIVTSIIGYVAAATAFKSGVGLFVAIVVLGLFFYVSFNKLNTEKGEWETRKAAHFKRHSIWQDMKNNPPILHSLAIASGGKSSTIYSFDKSQLIEANNAIKNSMLKKTSESYSFNIESVNVGSPESINNFGSKIYNQTLKQTV